MDWRDENFLPGYLYPIILDNQRPKQNAWSLASWLLQCIIEAVHQDQNNYLGSCLPIILQVARLNSRDSFQQEFSKLAASKLAPDRSDLVGSSWNWSQCIPGRSVCSVLSFFVLTHSCHPPHPTHPLTPSPHFPLPQKSRLFSVLHFGPWVTAGDTCDPHW